VTGIDPALPHPALAPSRASLRFMLRHPAHALALGFGCGLAPAAPGTVGTLGAWLVAALAAPWLGDAAWALLIGLTLIVGTWAATVTARHLGSADPSAVVVDEIAAFWIVLWLVTPAGFWGQAIAFALFRFFDAVKPAPVAWADRLFKARRGEPIGWAQGFGVIFDDLVAALCTLLVIALWRHFA
jgi:phosphatidylglycerophosphatase A